VTVVARSLPGTHRQLCHAVSSAGVRPTFDRPTAPRPDATIIPWLGGAEHGWISATRCVEQPPTAAVLSTTNTPASIRRADPRPCTPSFIADVTSSPPERCCPSPRSLPPVRRAGSMWQRAGWNRPSVATSRQDTTDNPYVVRNAKLSAAGSFRHDRTPRITLLRVRRRCLAPGSLLGYEARPRNQGRPVEARHGGVRPRAAGGRMRIQRFPGGDTVDVGFVR